VAVVAGLAVAVGTSIVGPIATLRRDVQVVAEGDLDHKVSTDRRDELGILSRDIGRMVVSLQRSMASRDDLEHEVAERMNAEKEVRNLNLTLEKRVRDRTRLLTQRKIQLEIANQDLEGFSYSVSHDLRAPLRAIDGFVAILEEDHSAKLDDEGRRILSVISSNARKMGLLIDDILAFSRAGRLELERSKVDMNALVTEVWEDLSTDRGDDEYQFSCEQLPEIYGDAHALRQVWQNLLANAIKFSKKNAPAKIVVGANRLATEICYSVTDNGVGFDEAYMDKLFSLFQRLHSVNEFEGAGVGLAIVKRFVRKHGGRVEASGTLGDGAVFSFILPADGDSDLAASEVRL